MENAWLDIEVRHFSDFESNSPINIPLLYHRMTVSWLYYDDYLADRDPKLKRYAKYPSFISAAIHNIGTLNYLIPQETQLITQLQDYRHRIPRCGCILLNDSLTQILLVKSFYSNTFCTSCGKINEGEDTVKAAIRETFEETNFDVSTFIDSDLVIEDNKEHMTRLYVIPDVPEDYPFRPRTRKEIREIKWFDLSAVNNKTTYGIKPILGQLYEIIREIKNRNKNKH